MCLLYLVYLRQPGTCSNTISCLLYIFRMYTYTRLPSAEFDCRSITRGSRLTHTCLVDAIRALGIKVPYDRNGPFWAVHDGSSMLAPLTSRRQGCIFFVKTSTFKDYVSSQMARHHLHETTGQGTTSQRPYRCCRLFHGNVSSSSIRAHASLSTGNQKVPVTISSEDQWLDGT